MLMGNTGNPIMEKEINGCSVTLSFVVNPVEGVIEKVKFILSNAYDERVQNELIEITSRK